MFHFEWPWMWLILPIPILVYWLSPPISSQSTAIRFPSFNEVTALSGSSVNRKNLWHRLLVSVCWCLLITGAARPQWIGDVIDIPISGRDLMIAVDVSGSMEAEDMVHEGSPENRLETVKRVAGQFIQNRVGDRVGLILFGSQAYLQSPLSLDVETVNILLQESAIGIAGEKTAIGDAIGLAIKRLQDESADEEENKPVNEKVLILLTDGANTAGSVEPDQAAQLAAQQQLTIHTIGIGSDRMAVRGLLGTQVINPSRDLDEKLLRAISQYSGGQYFRATNTESLLEIYNIIDRLEPLEQESVQLRPTRELFYWPLSLACLLIFLAACIYMIPKQTLSKA